MTAPAPSVLDTHVLLWWIGQRAKLSKRAARTIDRAIAERDPRIVVSAISLWEVAMLSSKGRIELDRPVAAWVNDLIATAGITVAAIDAATAVVAAELPSFHGDPADRMIVATAILARATLVTKDDRIRGWARSSGRVTTIW